MTLSLTQQHLFSLFNLAPVVSLKRLFQVFEEIVKCTQDEPNVISLERLYLEIAEVNREIQCYDLEIVATIDELSSKRLFILVNTCENTIAQKAKFYDKSTTQFFSKIVQGCVLSEEGYLTETECLNLNSDVGISKHTAQTILEKLRKDKWLVRKDGNFSLAMRSVVELEQIIKQQYPDEVKFCPFCNLMIIRGYICHSCKTRIHYACLTKLFSAPKSKFTCPKCNEVWEDVHHYLPRTNLDGIAVNEGVSTPHEPIPAKRKRKS